MPTLSDIQAEIVELKETLIGNNTVKCLFMKCHGLTDDMLQKKKIQNMPCFSSRYLKCTLRISGVGNEPET